MKIVISPHKRLYLLLTIVWIALLALIIGGSAYGVKFMKQKSQVISDLKTKNDLFDERTLAATKSRKQLSEYQSFQAVADKILPKDKEQSNSLVEIDKMAQAAGMKVTGITYSDGKAATSATTAAPKVSQTFPVDGLPNILGMQVDVTYSNAISFDKLITYLESVEKNQRKIQITSLDLQNFDPSKGLIQVKRATMRFYLKP